MKKVYQALGKILPVSPSLLEQAQDHLDSLTKPPGSLGRLEELACRYAAIKGLDEPQIRKKTIVVFAADHGVTAEGISAYPAEVTAQMVLNFLDGGAAINVLANHVSAEVLVVDIGVNYDFGPQPSLIQNKVAYGTKNMTQGPSMTHEQAERALLFGIEQAKELAGRGVDILGTGDMGIGNTTASAAILSVLGQRPVQETAGRGTGITDETLRRKVAVIERAIQVNRPNPEDPIDVLTKVGGLEIAGITGFIIGAAETGTPVVIDGLISGAGAVIALKLKNTVRDYIFCSHRSQEPGHDVCFQLLEQKPLFDFGMRLGEGTGAVLAMSLLEAGVKIYSEMSTFQKAGVSGRTGNS